MVAIKKLNSESTQGFQEWQVSLISFFLIIIIKCRTIVYEIVGNMSL
jgi:hypothetical protein